MTNSAPIDASAFRAFEHRGWESSAGAYDRYFGPLTAQTTPALLDAVSAGPGKRLLDIATGPGYVAASAARLGAIVVGADFSRKMIGRARASNAGLNIGFVAGDAEALPFASNIFDSVAMNFGILHLANPDRAIEEAHRAVKRGGWFGFTVWAKSEEAAGFDIALRAVETCGDPSVSLPAGPPFFRFSDREECDRCLQNAGFTDTSAAMLPLVWDLDSPDDLFRAFLEGTARTGGLLRAQPAERIPAILNDVRKRCAKFIVGNKLRVPMPALVVSARKP